MNKADILGDCILNKLSDTVQDESKLLELMTMVNDLSDLADPQADILRTTERRLEELEARQKGYVLLPVEPNESITEADFTDFVLIHFVGEGGSMADAAENHRALCEYLTKDLGTLKMNELAVEKEIQEKDLNAPRLTPEAIDATIESESYHVFEGTCLTVCCLTLKNGFTVTGESACASPENFDEELGRKIARDNARNKIWPLEGYLLKDKLASGR